MYDFSKPKMLTTSGGVTSRRCSADDGGKFRHLIVQLILFYDF